MEAAGQAIRIGISQCLLGELVRFDGGHKRDPFLTDTLGRFVTYVSSAADQLPFVWGLLEGRLVRLVVDRLVAAATRDAQAFWRSLQELAGVRNEMVEAMAVKAAKEREALAAEHAKALDRARAEAGAAAVERVVAALVEAEPGLADGIEGARRPR